MAQTHPQPAAEAVPSDCISQTILDFMLPFFLAAAGGDADLARAAIFELLDAYNAVTTPELDLAGRIIIFSTAAMDDLRLSMSDPQMSDTKKLRYRSNAVALSRSAEQCRKVLEAMQAKRQATNQPPAPAFSELPQTAITQAATAQAATARLTAAEPPAPQPGETMSPPAPPKSEQTQPTVQVARPATQPTPKVPPVGANGSAISGADIEQMKREAGIMIQALRANGGTLSAVADPYVPDPFAKAKAAAHAALAAAGIKPAQPAATGTRC